MTFVNQIYHCITNFFNRYGRIIREDGLVNAIKKQYEDLLSEIETISFDSDFVTIGNIIKNHRERVQEEQFKELGHAVIQRVHNTTTTNELVVENGRVYYRFIYNF